MSFRAIYLRLVVVTVAISWLYPAAVVAIRPYGYQQQQQHASHIGYY